MSGFLLDPHAAIRARRESRGFAWRALAGALALSLFLAWTWPNAEAAETSGEGAQPPEHLRTPGMLAEGRRVFDIHCSPCHGDAGRGGIGPRLTDSETLNGPRFADMVRVITNGVESTGMPRWATKLGPERIAIVAAYVFSLWGTQPDDPPGSDPGRKQRLRQGLMVWMPAAWAFAR